MEHNGGHLFFRAAGRGEALVLVHGFTLDHRLWSRQFERFRSGFRVIAYDCRGFGRSSLPTSPYSPADDLRAVLDRLGIARAHLVGLSMGGRIAVNFALAHAERVSSLCLLGSDVGGYRFSFDWDPPGDTLAAMRAAWLDNAVFDGVRATPALFREVAAMVADYTGFHWCADDPRVSDRDAVRLLHRITARTSVVVGENDLPDFHVVARILADRIPSAGLEVVPGAGHLLPLECVDACGELVARHVAASVARGRPGEPGSR
ncbi:alpha/beta fold hydrolase [Streptomyces sp. NPDC056353]|uniref:alpha/beta fold hydrolase n=1 Tax=unclassified Streptomyces TaxID=2593676 RepID=UPI0013CBDFE0|nr:alpha/beta hydrolase [Streptomyces sp. V17-9]NDZ71432.1 alpha/beta fold hydrolase [Streptomyces sp. SID10362]QUW95264.1 2-hydroxy-6-oxononadienedioate/2-hydroxy-6-oxononatrienedioate hydrolase [Streptomyces sp. V17-9]